MIQDILDQQPDIISFQESRKVQVDDLIVGLQDVYNCTSITVWNGGDVSFLVSSFLLFLFFSFSCAFSASSSWLREYCC